MSLFDETNRLTAQGIQELQAHADMVECECPTHLLAILAKVREFSAYTKSCIKLYPSDAPTHEWLLQSSQNLDSMLSSTIVQLARFEGFVDANNAFINRDIPKAVSER